ncbi:aromatic alcohol reductase, partial [Klebsiella pneumoniae]
TQVTVTSPADIGRLTTAIYLHQPRIVNEVVFVAGETTSYRQLADTVERVTQQTFSKAVHTLPALLGIAPGELLDFSANINPLGMPRYRAAFARGDGVWWPMGDTWNARHQLPTQDIAGWLQTAR